MQLNQLLRQHLIWACVYLFLICLLVCLVVCLIGYFSVHIPVFVSVRMISKLPHIYVVYLWKDLGRSVEIAISPENWRSNGCIILSHTNKMRVDQPESGLPVNNNPARPHQIWIVEKRTLKKMRKKRRGPYQKDAFNSETQKCANCANKFVIMVFCQCKFWAFYIDFRCSFAKGGRYYALFL